MNGKYNKYISVLMIFLLCVNTYGFIFRLSNNVKSTIFTDQTQAMLHTSEGTDPMNLKVGSIYSPYTLEPVESWDSPSNNVIQQVVETLFAYDLANPELPMINLLAESYYWINSTSLHVTLRQGIMFHDYTSFNAAAAKWNLNRLLYLTNCTGTNTGQVANTRSLWLFPNTEIPIISDIATYGEWELNINLNAPYGPLLHLLSYINAGMLSPASTPPTEFVDLYSDVLVGTGPFRYGYYDPDVELKYYRWDNYWRTPAFFEEMTITLFGDSAVASNALLAHTVDILDFISVDYIPVFEADPKITLKRFTEDTGKPGFAYFYMGMNNQKYNKTWRKVMSYALNYTFVIEELRAGNAIRANSPISPAFGASYNENAQAASFNITEARTLMQSMGFGVGFTTDQEWINVAESSPFLNVKYTYNIGNTFRENFGTAVQEWFKLVGIAIQFDGVMWSDFLFYLFEDKDYLDIYQLGWSPDFLDPHNMLDTMFNPISYSNFAQVDDPYLTSLLALALETTDEITRNNFYKDIQEYMAEVGFFDAPLYFNKVNFAHLTEIDGVPYNARELFYAYPIYRLTPSAFSLTSDAGTPDDDGDFTLSWTMADGVETYFVYESANFIDALDGDENLIAQTSDLSLFLSGYPEGVYYFIVAATNMYGYTLSNCIEVIVELVDPHDLVVYLDIPSGIQIDNTYMITATVQNVGQFDETDIELLLYIDDIVVDSLTIPYLPVGDIGTILYEWTPTEYKTYSIKTYAPPVVDETSVDDNMIIKDVTVTETQIFDGLFIEYIFGQMGYYYETNFTYTPYQDGLFYETWNIGVGIYQWVVDPSTRIMSGMSIFGDGAHTPVWIFTEANLGDLIPVAVDGEGDHLFTVADEFIYDLPGFGPVGVWVLEDTTFPGGYAWYEKSTGILLQGLFYYYYGMYNYTMNFIDTNAQFDYVTGPGDFTLASDADDPDHDGMFTLFWTESEGATSYSVYQSDSYISEITGELIMIADGITSFELPLEGYIDGTYYFIAVAHNEDGDTLSNCIQVNVELKLPPVLMYDTIPEELTLTYTRASQVIGSMTAYSTSQIIYVGFIVPNPGFALDTTYTVFENGEGYLSETRLMTTNQLEPGIHSLTIRFYNADGMYYDKNITITVYRQAELNLRGEFDYFLKEKVKISIVAQVVDMEDQFLLDPIMVEGIIVHIKIMDYNGNIKVEDTMTYNPDGFFHWDSEETIHQLGSTFPKGIYIVQAWIEYPPDCYYMGGIDVIEFHIDPPAEEELDPWLIFGMVSLSGFLAVSIALAVLLKRKRRIE